MVACERIYKRTEAGSRACLSEGSGLSSTYRRILTLADSDTHFNVPRTALPKYDEHQLHASLEQLETLGFIESKSAGAECNLDFTALLSFGVR